jgi:hypothetical protein
MRRHLGQEASAAESWRCYFITAPPFETQSEGYAWMNGIRRRTARPILDDRRLPPR